jgi:hypothetical protein
MQQDAALRQAEVLAPWLGRLWHVAPELKVACYRAVPYCVFVFASCLVQGSMWSQYHFTTGIDVQHIPSTVEQQCVS